MVFCPLIPSSAIRAFISALKLRRCLVFILTPFEARDFTPYSSVRILGSSSSHRFPMHVLLCSVQIMQCSNAMFPESRHTRQTLQQLSARNTRDDRPRKRRVKFTNA